MARRRDWRSVAAVVSREWDLGDPVRASSSVEGGGAPEGGWAPETGDPPEGGVAALPTTSAGGDFGDNGF